MQLLKTIWAEKFVENVLSDYFIINNWIMSVFAVGYPRCYFFFTNYYQIYTHSKPSHILLSILLRFYCKRCGRFCTGERSLAREDRPGWRRITANKSIEVLKIKEWKMRLELFIQNDEQVVVDLEFYL